MVLCTNFGRARNIMPLQPPLRSSAQPSIAIAIAAWLFYLAPVLFPGAIWLGVG